MAPELRKIFKKLNVLGEMYTQIHKRNLANNTGGGGGGGAN
jgi:hypothetical protein